MPDLERNLAARKALNDQLTKSAIKTAILQHVAALNAIDPKADLFQGEVKFKLNLKAPGAEPEITFETNH